jgi:hypothetical protein
MESMMSHETVKISGSLRDRVVRLLGGKNPTANRVESLLTELEQARALRGEGTFVPDPPDPPPLSEEETAALLDEADHGAATHFEEPPTVVPAAPTSELELLREQNRILLEGMKLLEKKVDALGKAPTLTPEEARAGGQLLPPSVAAPPLGLTGPAAWPIGEWFVSPLGPRVYVKICECCGRGTQHHWYCCVCKSGPHHYQSVCRDHHDPQRNPNYIKNHFAPGGVWGISHSCCSPLCYMQYMNFLGVIPGVNDAEPPSVQPMAQLPMPGAPPVPANAQPARRGFDSD